MCRSRLCGREVGGGFAIGQDSDLLVRMKGKHIIQAEIHTCQNCRFSGFTRDFAINTLPETGEQFLNEVTPQLTGAPKGSITSTPLPDVQYYWAFRAGVFLRRPAIHLGDKLLRAYWCLRLPPSSQLPPAKLQSRKAMYLQECIEHFTQSLRGNRNPHLYYLLAELNRRHGDFEASTSLFKKFLTRRDVAKYLKVAAAKLSQCAEERDARDMTMEEILYDQKTESSGG
jgi:hypothetical protein